MFDIWMGEIELTRFVLLFSLVLLLPAQLLLCFKVRSRVVRLLPVILLSVLTVLPAAVSVLAAGWDGLGYLFLSLFAGFMLFICGIGWGIWGLARLAKKKSEGSSSVE